MFPDFNIHSTPLLLLTIQGLFFSILLFKRYVEKKNLTDLLLALILCITCYHQTSYTIGFMDWYDTYKSTKVNYYLINLSLGLAPLIYFYFRTITNPKQSLLKKDLLHFIPVILLVLIRVLILIYDANQEDFDMVQNGYLVINFQWKYLDPFIGLVSMLQMLIYLVLSFQLLYSYREKIKHFFSNTFKLELNWLNKFLIVYTILYIYYSIQLVVNATIINLSWRQEWWYYLLSGLVIIYVGIKGYFTDLSKLKEIEIASFLNENKLISNVKSNTENNFELSSKITFVKKSIEEQFEKNKLYLEPDLTLVSLSNKLSISREELSETINKGFNLRFNDFINKYRVEEFKQKLIKGKHNHLSLLGIAYECGFNSKATFNRAFKKFNNTSPSEYLKSIM